MAGTDALSFVNRFLKTFSDLGLLQGFLPLIVACTILWVIGRRYFSDLGGLPIPGLKTPRFNIFGSLHTMPSNRTAKMLSLPQSTFLLQTLEGNAKLLQNEKLWYFDIAYTRFVFLTDPEATEALLRSTKILQKSWSYKMIHPWLGTGLLTSSGSKWKSRRKLLTPAFHFDILRDFLPIIDEQSKILVQVLKEKVNEDCVDIRSPVTLCSLDIICESTLGVHIGAQRNSKSDYVQAVIRASETVMERFCKPYMWLDPMFRMTELGRQFGKDVNTLHSFTRKVIHQKKASLKQRKEREERGEETDVSFDSPKKKRMALMDLLIEHQVKHGDITEEDIREEVDTFVFEGHDTTSMGMAWALYLIGLYPDVQAKLHEELDRIYGDDVERAVTGDDLKDLQYLELVLKESQRLYPSVPLFAREAEEDVDICGYNVRKGNTIAVCTYVLHRDPKTFPDPEKFDPDRFLPENSVGRHPFSYVPFSAGSRNCIGQRFAVMEEKVVITNILRNFYLKSRDARDKLPVAAELILRPVRPINVKFIPRTSIGSSVS